MMFPLCKAGAIYAKVGDSIIFDLIRSVKEYKISIPKSSNNCPVPNCYDFDDEKIKKYISTQIFAENGIAKRKIIFLKSGVYQIGKEVDNNESGFWMIIVRRRTFSEYFNSKF